MQRLVLLPALACAVVASPGYLPDGSSFIQRSLSGVAEANGQTTDLGRPRGRLVAPSAEQASHLDGREVLKLEAVMGRLRARGKRNVALATFSAEFVSLANNFACSWLASVGNDTGLVLVALDGHCEGLSSSFVNAHVECVPIEPTVSPPLEAERVHFKSPRYLFMTRMKLAVFSVWLDLAAAHGESRWVLLSDVDVTVSHDPFEYVNEVYPLHRHRRASPVLCAPNTPSCPPHSNKSKINSGFCFYPAGADSSQLLRSALSILVAGNSSDGADQGAIREALMTRTGHGSMAVDTMLPCKRFPVGRFFRNPEAYEDPVAIHANYMATDQKEPCFRASGRWFVSDAPGANCRAAGVRSSGYECG